jgi:HAD superfamily hydrolase (TIGR01450 family)
MATTNHMNGIPELQRRYSPADLPIKGIISDLDGVAYRDNDPIPGSVQAFRAWHERGVPYAFVTNNSTKSAAQFATKLSGMGIPATAAQVINTISAVTSLLQQRWPPGTPVFAIGEQPLLETLEQSGYRLTGTDAEVVVLGFDSELNYAKLRTAIRAALAGATIIATCRRSLMHSHDASAPTVSRASASGWFMPICALQTCWSTGNGSALSTSTTAALPGSSTISPRL